METLGEGPWGQGAGSRGLEEPMHWVVQGQQVAPVAGAGGGVAGGRMGRDGIPYVNSEMVGRGLGHRRQPGGPCGMRTMCPS